MGEQVCACVSTGAHRARRALDPPELQLQAGRALALPELQLQVVVSCPMLVLETELGFSARTVTTHNP